ncbi:MAG: hypothetical protein ABI673_10085 [Novosphingobium sp.]
MATRPISRPEGPGPQHFIPPTARELRAQAVHRLQIGLLGLAAMLLIVGLANIIMDRARLTDGALGSAELGTATATQAANTDPLADMGVVPLPESGSTKPHRK